MYRSGLSGGWGVVEGGGLPPGSAPSLWKRTCFNMRGSNTRSSGHRDVKGKGCRPYMEITNSVKRIILDDSNWTEKQNPNIEKKIYSTVIKRLLMRNCIASSLSYAIKELLFSSLRLIVPSSWQIWREVRCRASCVSRVRFCSKRVSPRHQT